MRKPSESVYELALSLSSREKAYFRKFAQNLVNNGNPEYLRLFNAILEQKVCNEADLKECFKGEGFINHFHKTKEFLYVNLLDSLQNFHRKNSTLTILLNIPPKIELLYEKQLYDQCLTLARKMSKLAIQLDMPEHVASAVLWELRLTFLQPAKYLDHRQVMQRLDLLEQIVKEKKSSNDYLRSHTELFINYYGRGQVTTEMDLMEMYEKVKTKKIFSEDYQPKGNGAKLYYLNFLQVYYQQIQDWENALRVTVELEGYYTDRPKLISGSAHAALSYVTTLFNKLMFSIEIENWEVAHQVLSSMEQARSNKMVKSSNRLQGLVFTYHALGGLLLFQRSGAWELGVEFANKVECELETGKWAIPENRAWEIRFRFLILQYWHGNMKESRILANRLWQEAEKKVDDGMYSNVLLIRSLIYLESTSEQEAVSAIGSAQRQLRKMNTHRSFVIFINLLFKLIHVGNEKELRLLLSAREKLEKLRTQSFESYAFAEFDLMAWIDQRVDGLAKNRS